MAHILYLDFDGVMHASGVLSGSAGPVLSAQGEARGLLEHNRMLAHLLGFAPDVRIVMSKWSMVAHGLYFSTAQVPLGAQHRVVDATFDPSPGGRGFTSVAWGYQVQDASQRKADCRIVVDDDVAESLSEAGHRPLPTNASRGLSRPDCRASIQDGARETAGRNALTPKDSKDGSAHR